MLRFPRILAATDLGAAADEAIRRASQWAHDEDGSLVVCRVLPPDEAGRADPRVESSLVERVEEVSGRLRDEFAALIRFGEPAAELLGVAREWEASLLVIGAGGASAPGGSPLGSTCDRVVRRAPCPVLVVRPGPRVGPVLAGTDFSDPALPVLRAARAAARRSGARLVAAHAVDLHAPGRDPFGMGARGPSRLSGSAETAARGRAEERLVRAVAAAADGAERRVVVGPAQRALPDLAERLGAELLVVGSHRWGGLGRFFLGSVAESVLRAAPCPVLVIRLARAGPA